jgi:hypothetical protein
VFRNEYLVLALLGGRIGVTCCLDVFAGVRSGSCGC